MPNAAGGPIIAIANRSTVVPDWQLEALFPALTTQLNYHFEPAWGLVKSDLILIIDKGARPTADMWLYVQDNSDVVGDLGYHELTPEGLPTGYCFAGTDMEYGEKWQVTLAHELLEIRKDPLCKALSLGIYQGKGVEFLTEVCDAVEDERFAYQIGDQWVSNFVLPPFFDTFLKHPPGTKFDYMGVVPAPLTIMPGGYLNLRPTAGGPWTNVLGDHVPLHKRLLTPGSRRFRFHIGQRNWRLSTAA